MVLLFLKPWLRLENTYSKSEFIKKKKKNYVKIFKHLSGFVV